MKRSCVLVLVGVLALLAGCSDGDPEPKIAPTDSSSAASSTSPSPSPSGPVEPTLPAEAEGEDAAAAEAFVRFYWEMVNYAQATGDVGALEALASESCDACAGGSDGIKATYSTGGSIRGGDTVVDSATASPLKSDRGTVFTVAVGATATPQVIEIPGERTVKNEGGQYTFEFIVRRDAGAWSVTRWSVDL